MSAASRPGFHDFVGISSLLLTYPTRDVVNTASPEILFFAPNDFPEKTGPSFQKHQLVNRTVSLWDPTLIVNVARSCSVGL